MLSDMCGCAQSACLKAMCCLSLHAFHAALPEVAGSFSFSDEGGRATEMTHRSGTKVNLAAHAVILPSFAIVDNWSDHTARVELQDDGEQSVSYVCYQLRKKHDPLRARIEKYAGTKVSAFVDTADSLRDVYLQECATAKRGEVASKASIIAGAKQMRKKVGAAKARIVRQANAKAGAKRRRVSLLD